MQEVRSDKELEVSYMTIAQKMLDERKLGYLEGLEDAVTALKGVLDPVMSLSLGYKGCAVKVRSTRGDVGADKRAQKTRRK